VAALGLITAMSVLTGQAVGQSTGSVESRMDSIQARLDEATARIEELRTEKDNLETRISSIRARMGSLSDREAKLLSIAAARASEIYKAGTSAPVEALLGSDSLADVVANAEMLSQVSDHESSVFVDLTRAQAELNRLNKELSVERKDLATAEMTLTDESKRLQSQFAEVKAEYERLTRKVAPASTSSSAPSAPLLRSTDGMYCPVAGPTSFVDSWGAPRSGHTHQGVDMMGSYGTPLAAVVSGTITYAAYDGSGGNMLFLSGSDGNAYWYMHNQENYVGQGASVKAGEIIGTLGDTGNAAGTPHLHFEYHPGGGAAINPYPLVSQLC
jgi:murein DD-endopeptidase MepM/ murein hydrolase activator NlpD